MSKKSKSETIFRRKVNKGFGGSVIGESILMHSLPALSKDENNEQLPLHNGKVPLILKVNCKLVKLLIEPRTKLVKLLRDHLHLTGTKIICN